MTTIYQHFRPEERDFIDQILQMAMKVEEEYAPKLTYFLDPRQRYIAETVISSYSDLHISIFGGVDKAERTRAFIHPNYYKPSQEDFQITPFRIHYPVKFTTLSHQKILGALMSLGIKREAFGDIINAGTKWQICVQTEMKNYVQAELSKIGKDNVELEEIPLEELIAVEEKWNEKTMTVTSTRLDTLLASSFSFSRQKAKQLIQNGFVKANWKTIENPSFLCEEKDMISIRGHGRMKVVQQHGRTKKGKIRLTMGFLK